MTHTSNDSGNWNGTTTVESTTIDNRLPFTTEAAITVSVILFIMLIFTLIANIITIVVILKSPKLSSVFSMFIVSLCFSDMASALVSPIFIYRRTIGFQKWEIPDFLCNLSWCVHMWTNYVTSIHIVCFASLRLCAVAKPIRFKEIKKLQALICICLMWFICFFAGGVPFLIFFGVRYPDDKMHKSPACGAQENKKDQFHLYTQIAYPIFFYAPVILVTALSAAILIKYLKRRKKLQEHETSSNPKLQEHETSSNPKSLPLETVSIDTEVTKKREKNKTKHRSRQEKSAILQLVLIVFSFFIGYLPFTIYQLISYAHSPDVEMTYQLRRGDWTFGITEYIFLRLSECLNPVFYNLASLTMRTETIVLLRGMCDCLRRT